MYVKSKLGSTHYLDHDNIITHTRSVSTTSSGATEYDTTRRNTCLGSINRASVLHCKASCAHMSYLLNCLIAKTGSTSVEYTELLLQVGTSLKYEMDPC